MCCLEDAIQYTGQIVKDLVIAEAEHRIAEDRETFGTCLIIVLAIVVTTAVEFYHQPTLNTHKVEDEYPERVLTTKVESAKLPPAQMLPQHRLSRCPTVAHEPRRAFGGRPC